MNDTPHGPIPLESYFAPATVAPRPASTPHPSGRTPVPNAAVSHRLKQAQETRYNAFTSEPVSHAC